MKALTLAGAVAIAFTFGTAMAMAQSGAHVGDGQNSVTPPYPYNSGGAAAKVGDGVNGTQAPYSYNVGTGAAQVGDGSNSQTPSPTTPGYNVGTGSSGRGASREYPHGGAQSLAPPSGMAQAEQPSNSTK